MLRTKKGVCIDVEVFVNCKFGYDINCEVVCEDGALKMAQPGLPVHPQKRSCIQCLDTDCFVRFKDAYDKEVQDWVDNAEAGVITGPNAWDRIPGSDHSGRSCKSTGNRTDRENRYSS